MLVNIVSSFFGSASAVYIFPYIKEYIKRGEKYFKEFEEKLQKFDFTCRKVLMNMKLYAYDEDEINDYDALYYEGEYDELKNIHTSILKNKNEVEKALFGGYENIFNEYITGVQKNFEKEQKDLSKIYERFELEGTYSECELINHYYNQILIQSNFSSNLLNMTKEMYNKKWIIKISKKVASLF